MGGCSHAWNLSPCPSWTSHTWFKMDSHFSSTRSPSPSLVAAAQYKWFEMEWHQSLICSHPFFFDSNWSFLKIPVTEIRYINDEFYKATTCYIIIYNFTFQLMIYLWQHARHRTNVLWRFLLSPYSSLLAHVCLW